MAKDTIDPSTSGSDRYGSAERAAHASSDPTMPPIPPGSEAPASPGAAFAEVGQRLGEAWLFLQYYIQTRLDLIKLSIRRLVLMAVLGVVGLLAGGAMVVAAGVLVVVGVAHLIGYFTGYYWLGDLITGAALLAGVAVVAYLAIGWVTRTSRTATVSEYERRLRQQREHYGTDVHERAQRN